MAAAGKREVELRKTMHIQPANSLRMRIQIESRKAVVKVTVFFL
jgi:hypothetical protein